MSPTDFFDPSLRGLADVGQRHVVLQGRRPAERAETPINPPEAADGLQEAPSSPEQAGDDDDTIEQLLDAGFILSHGVWRR